MDVSGNRPGITRMGEVGNQHFFVPGRFDRFFRFSTGDVLGKSVWGSPAEQPVMANISHAKRNKSFVSYLLF